MEKKPYIVLWYDFFGEIIQQINFVHGDNDVKCAPIGACK